MSRDQSFFKSVCGLAIPAALQSMLQSSFSIVDQIMIGQLGEASVAGVGLAGKFSGIFSVAASALGAVAGIMIAQYLGQEERAEARRSFRLNLSLALAIAGLFTALCLSVPRQVMGLYTPDRDTLEEAARYLTILSGSFLPMAGSALLAALFRCAERADLPLYASICAAAANTGLNYVLIFGRLGIAPMGAAGAAIATVASQCLGLLLMLAMYRRLRAKLPQAGERAGAARFHWRQYGSILLPVLVCELLWSVGENVYAAIYGHLGTDACAAMTLTGPVQGLTIGALCGLSQAASVMIGKLLGAGDWEGARLAAKKLMLYGLAGSLTLSAAVAATSGLYVEIYRVEVPVKLLARQILLAYAAVAPFKVQNMILGGGILRSGGKTKYVMAIDLIGTWAFGVPLGFLAAFVLELPIPWTYLLLSLEECVRSGISLMVFRGKGWMNSLEVGGPGENTLRRPAVRQRARPGRGAPETGRGPAGGPHRGGVRPGPRPR